MSLNFEEGRKLAIIEGLPKGHNKNTLYIDEDKDREDGSDTIELKKGKFNISFNKDMERITASLFGMAGSGKSYMAGQLVREYHRVWPKNPVFLFSEKAEDAVFDTLKYVERVKMNTLLEDPLEYDEIPENSLLVFDDVDGYEKKLKKAVYAIRDKCLKLGRSRGISVISTDHSCSGLDMKAVLNETMYYFIFPINWNRSYKYLCEEYLGLTKENLEKMGEMPDSRWVCYVKNYPSVLMGESWAFILGKKKKFK